MVTFDCLRLAGKVFQDKYDIIVVGGGLAGVCAAIAASRHGCKTAIVQNRPVFGGNSSSEIRIQPTGANRCGGWARETGIIEELLIEERARNHDLFLNGRINSIWDLILYEWIKKEPNLTPYLNTHAIGVLMENSNKISAVVCFQEGSERIFTLYGSFFIDCTGDGTIGAAAGAEFRYGRESQKEFNESLAPSEADDVVQGSSLLLRARDAGRNVPFTPPDWIEKYPTEESLHRRKHPRSKSYDGRVEFAGYWWIEIGNPFHIIDENEEIRDELLCHLLGVWDHIKNQGSHGSEKAALEWVGMVPGKRESRRLVGDYILTENDVRDGALFYDRVAYGGWPIDIHTPGGILAKGKPPEPLTGDPDLSQIFMIEPYSIPLRCLYSRNIMNLFMAGRNISVTHVALGTTRVMLTCSLIGQAAGTAAALCVKKNVTPRDIVKDPHLLWKLQQTLLKDDCYIIDMKNEDPYDFALKAKKVEATSSMQLTLDPVDKFSSLNPFRSQIFPISGDFIQTLSLYLRSECSKESSIRLEILNAQDIWSFNKNGSPLKIIGINVPSNFEGWLKVPVNLEVRAHSLYQLNVYGKKEIFWYHSKPLPGVSAAYKKKGWKRWIHEKIVYALRVEPPSEPYGPENVINGVARPEKWTNIWISDPHEKFPQTITLHFNGYISINTVYLTFDTYLHENTHIFPPLYKVPECVRDYIIRAHSNNGWETVTNYKDNYHRRRKHNFRTINADKLQIEVKSTNGAETARIYEVRIYKE